MSRRLHSRKKRSFVASKSSKSPNSFVNHNHSLPKHQRRGSSRSTDSGSEIDDLSATLAASGTTRVAQPQGQVRAGLRSLSSDKPVQVKFVNHSGREVQLYWINYIGECEKAFKIADGKNEIIDTFESHPWLAANARNKKVHHAFTINANLVYCPVKGPDGGKYAVAEIRKAPEKLEDLVSKPSKVEVAVKFVNKTARPANIEWIDHNGNRELRKIIEPGQDWTVETHEQTYWIAIGNKETDEGLLLNYGWYYSPRKSKSKRERVFITDYL